MADPLEPGLVYFKFHSSGEIITITQEQANPLVRQGQGTIVPASSLGKVAPIQAFTQAASHQRVFATVPADVMETARLRMENDKVQFQDRSINIADVVASLLRDYGLGKISIKGSILKSP